LELIVGAAVGHAQVESFVSRGVFLHPGRDANETSRTGLGSRTGKTSYFRLDRAVFEVGRLDDCENLAATHRPGGAVVVDNLYRAARAITGDIGLDLHRVCADVAYALYFQPIHGIQRKRQTLHSSFVIIAGGLACSLFPPTARTQTNTVTASNRCFNPSMFLSS
jgi:hypothetical protein